MASNNGYIKISRGLFNHYLWKEKRVFSKLEAWIDLIATAKYSTDISKELINAKIISWNRGQLPASVRYLKERWGWSSNTKVDYFIKLLESDGMIKTAKEQGITIITICKYDEYNSIFEKEINQIGQQSDSNQTAIRQASDNDKTNTGRNRKKVNTLKKVNKENISLHPQTLILEDELILLKSDIDIENYKSIFYFIDSSSRLKSLPENITAKNYLELIKSYSIDEIVDMIRQMNDWKGITKKNSIYLTLSNWLRDRYGNKEIKDFLPKFQNVYSNFIVKLSGGSAPKMNNTDTRSMIEIMNYLKKNNTINPDTLDGGLYAWNKILENWFLLDEFMRARVKLNEISNDILKIIIKIKDESTKRTEKGKDSSSIGTNKGASNLSGKKEF